jgi:hypothetical protein
VFDANSRYAGAVQASVTDGRGRKVSVALYPPQPVGTLLGYHIRRDGQTLDHLAAKYLGDNDAYWRIAWFNAVLDAEILAEAREIAIPAPGR